MSIFIPMGVLQRCVHTLHFSKICLDWVVYRAVDQSHCGTSIGDARVTDLVFADNAVVLA